MEEKDNLTAERSLEIIRESIERSQRTITRNSAVPMIWWGVCVVVFSFIIAYLWANHGGPTWNALWAVMWLVGYVGNWIIDKKKETVPTTFVGKTIGYVWTTFGMFCGGLGFLFCFIGNGLLPLELVVLRALFPCVSVWERPSRDSSSAIASFRFAASSRVWAASSVPCISLVTHNSM